MIDDLVAFQHLNRLREANQRGIYVCHIQLAVLQEIGFDHRHCSPSSVDEKCNVFISYFLKLFHSKVIKSLRRKRLQKMNERK